MKRLLFLSLSLFLLYLNLKGQENPFVKMAGQPFATYIDSLEQIVYNNIGRYNQSQAEQTAAQMREAAKITKNKKWNIEADYFELLYRYAFDKRQEGITQDQIDNLTKGYINNLQQIIRKAQKIKAADIEMRALYDVFGSYFFFLQNYEMGFSYAIALDKALLHVPATEFPLKIFYYAQIASQYYSFGDYVLAKRYYEKVVENPSIANDQRVLETAWNHLGLIYRMYDNDLPASDSCFHQILEIRQYHPSQDEPDVWVVIALGNIGANYYLSGDYHHAIPLLAYSVEKTLAHNMGNHSFAIGKALTLVVIFMELHQWDDAKMFAGIARDILQREITKSEIESIELWIDYYHVMSTYYRTLGHYEQALYYVDSTAIARSWLGSNINPSPTFYTPPTPELHFKSEKLNMATMADLINQQYVIFTFVFALLMLLLFVTLFCLYRKNRIISRALALKVQQWAHAPIPLIKSDIEDNPLFAQLNQLMADRHVHNNPNATLEYVAQLLDVHGMYLSQALHQCVGLNFKSYINELRIKDAVCIMTNVPSQNISTKKIALDAGFYDFKIFCRVFKQITGLSLSKFQNNL